MKTKFALFLLVLFGQKNGYSQVINVANGLNLPTPIFIDGNDLYVAEINSDKITKFDANLVNQTLGATIAIGTNIPNSFARYGNYLYLAKNIGNQNDKIVRIDLSVSNSLPTDFLTVYQDINGINQSFNIGTLHIIGNYLYITDDFLNGVLKVDLTQSNPIPSIVVTGISKPYGLASKGNDLYISQWDNGNLTNYSSIYKIDITQPNPSLTTIVTGLGSIPSIAIKCNTLFINNTDELKISYINLTQPNPILTTLLYPIANVSLAVKDDYLYFEQYALNEISKIDISSVVNEVPTFTQIAPICSGTAISPLPTTSNNGIEGTWSPTFNSITTTNYTFTPNTLQCTTAAVMTVVVDPNLCNDTCWKSVALGQENTLAIKKNGTLWSWGMDALGNLGNGSPPGSITTITIPTQVGTDNDWQFITVGDYHSIAIKNNGTLWSWGWNQFYQLGLGNTNYTSIPTQVGTDNDWRYASALYGHSLALKSNNTLWSWGENTYGAVGNGNNSDQATPFQLAGNNWVDISAGDEHSIALDTFGNLYTWGANYLGQLGNGSNIDTNSPIISGQTSNGGHWKSISGSVYRTFGILNDGTLWMWGDGQNTPVQLGSDSDWKKIEACLYHGYIALKNDNTIWVYNFGIQGSLINPQQVGTDNDWIEIAAKYNSFAGIKADGSLWVWGRNMFGQIGNGTYEDSNVPVKITCDSILSTNFQSSNNLIVYPNPTNDIINIVSNLNINKMELLDINGRTVLQQNKNNSKINLEFIKSGIYLLKVITENEISIIKIIKN